MLTWESGSRQSNWQDRMRGTVLLSKQLLTVLISALGFLVLHAASARAQNEHQHAGAADHRAQLNQRGAQAMGFDQEKTTHHFRLFHDGGMVEVQANDAKGSATIDQIRLHLEQQSRLFAAGIFTAPSYTHGKLPPGAATMQKLAGKIKYEFKKTDRGGQLRISSADPTAVAAVHSFLKFQIEDHHTGDPTAPE